MSRLIEPPPKVDNLKQTFLSSYCSSPKTPPAETTSHVKRVKKTRRIATDNNNSPKVNEWLNEWAAKKKNKGLLSSTKPTDRDVDPLISLNIDNTGCKEHQSEVKYTKVEENIYKRIKGCDKENETVTEVKEIQTATEFSTLNQTEQPTVETGTKCKINPALTNKFEETTRKNHIHKVKPPSQEIETKYKDDTEGIKGMMEKSEKIKTIKKTCNKTQEGKIKYKDRGDTNEVGKKKYKRIKNFDEHHERKRLKKATRPMPELDYTITKNSGNKCKTIKDFLLKHKEMEPEQDSEITRNTSIASKVNKKKSKDCLEQNDTEHVARDISIGTEGEGKKRNDHRERKELKRLRNEIGDSREDTAKTKEKKSKKHNEPKVIEELIHKNETTKEDSGPSKSKKAKSKDHHEPIKVRQSKYETEVTKGKNSMLAGNEIKDDNEHSEIKTPRKSRKKHKRDHSVSDEHKSERKKHNSVRKRRLQKRHSITSDVGTNKKITDYQTEKDAKQQIVGKKGGTNPTKSVQNVYKTKYGVRLPSYESIVKDKENLQEYRQILAKAREVLQNSKRNKTNVVLDSPVKTVFLDCQHLSPLEINDYFMDNLDYCESIAKGVNQNSRHDRFLATRYHDELIINDSTITFSFDQKQQLINLFVKFVHFPKITNIKEYYFKVLLPELCTKIFMAVHNMDRQEAEVYLKSRPVDDVI